MNRFLDQLKKEVDEAKSTAESAKCALDRINKIEQQANNKIQKLDETIDTAATAMQGKSNSDKPSSIDALLAKAQEAGSIEDWPQAKAIWELLSLIESHNANVWFNLGYIKEQTGDSRSAIAQCYERSCLLVPSGLSYMNWGNNLSLLAKESVEFRSHNGFRQAEEKFSKAYGLEAFRSQILENWIVMLSMELNFLLDGSEKELTLIKKGLVEYQLIQKTSVLNKNEERAKLAADIKQKLQEKSLTASELLNHPLFLHLNKEPWIFNLERITNQLIAGSAQSKMIEEQMKNKAQRTFE